MEGKGVRTPFGTLIMCILILTLLVSQTQVEAKTCCPSITARGVYNACRAVYLSMQSCASQSGCQNVDGECPPGYDKGILENSGDAINEYCKLGCASSVCNAAIITLQNSGEESVKVAVEKCNNACSEFCTKQGSNIAFETS